MDFMGDQDRRVMRAVILAVAVAAAALIPIAVSLLLPGCHGEHPASAPPAAP